MLAVFSPFLFLFDSLGRSRPEPSHPPFQIPYPSDRRSCPAGIIANKAESCAKDSGQEQLAPSVTTRAEGNLRSWSCNSLRVHLYLLRTTLEVLQTYFRYCQVVRTNHNPSVDPTAAAARSAFSLRPRNRAIEPCAHFRTSTHSFIMIVQLFTSSELLNHYLILAPDGL